MASKRDPVQWMRNEYSDLVLTVRHHASRIVKHDRIRAGSGGGSAPEQLTANGMLSNLRAQVKLTSSGNTLTLAPTDNGIVPLYGDAGQGWVNTYLLSAVTLNTTGYTSNSMYDIYVYYDQVTSDPPAPALEAVIWSSETARSVALTTQDGVSLKSTDTTRRYLTTGRYNGSTMLVPTDNTNKESFWGTGDPRNNGSDPATGVGIFAGGVSLSSVVYMFFTILNGTVGFGVDLLGNLRAIAGGFKLNNSEMSLTISSNMVMQITAAYALFGSNVAAANTTAFAIFFTAQTYNTESMEAGAVLFGSNSSTYANVMWQPSTKRLLFRNGTSTQAYVNTDGAITAGAGAVTQDATGVSILVQSAFANETALKFLKSAGVTESSIYGYDTGTSANLIIASDPVTAGLSENSLMSVSSNAPSGKTAQTILAALGGSGAAQLAFAASNSVAAITVTGGINEAQASDLASAGTTDIGAVKGNYVKITGTTTITALGTIQAGTRRIVEFSGALTLTHNATSLILPGSANITTVAGDTAIFVSLGSGNWKCITYVPFTVTGTGAQVRKVSPAFTTPDIGVATGTSLALTGNFSADGNATLGNAAADTVTFNGTPAGLVVGGTYTPTLTNTTNVAASTSAQCNYMRVGNQVTVSGRIAIDPTAAAATLLEISLPIASNFGGAADCGGVAACGAVAGMSAAIDANTTNDTANLSYIATDLANRVWSFTFTYEII